MLQFVKRIRMTSIGMIGYLLALTLLITSCTQGKTNLVEEEIKEWKFKTEGSITSSPIISDGTLYFGSDDGNLYAVDAKNGTLKWKFAAGGSIRSTVSIANGLLYFLSHNGIIYALDKESGLLSWRYTTGSDILQMDEWDYYDSSPEVSEGIVYFGSSDRHLYALDAKTGAKQWSYLTMGAIKSSPTSDEQSVYIGDWSGYVYAVNKQTGKLTWTYKTDGMGRHVAIQSKPAISGDRLFVAGRDFNLYVLNKQTGDVIWKEPKPAWVGSPVVLEDTIYVGNSNGYYMEAIDAKTGDQKWVYTTASNVLAAPAISDGVLYFGSGEAYQTGQAEAFLYAVNRETGLELGKLKTNKIQSTPVVNGNTVYYTSFDGYLYAAKLPLTAP